MELPKPVIQSDSLAKRDHAARSFSARSEHTIASRRAFLAGLGLFARLVRSSLTDLLVTPGLLAQLYGDHDDLLQVLQIVPGPGGGKVGKQGKRGG